MSSGTIEIAFGRGTLGVELPPGAEGHVIRKGGMTHFDDPAAAVRQALQQPVGSPPLFRLAASARSACILVCDITRPVPNGLFLRPMIETMMAAGLPRDRLEIIVATGLHRPNLGEELAEVIGDHWVLDTIRVTNHDARDAAAQVDLGTTSGHGTPIRINRRFFEADLRIATGLVEPHFMAGWSGGRKVVAPGVAGQETIRTFHSARFMENPLAVQCNLTGNPLHEEQLEIIGRIGPVHALNTVIDEDRRLCCVTFGEVVQSHLAAVDYVTAATHVPVARRYRTVVTSAGGYPLDTTYYQTIKSMVTPLEILEPGGTLIVASECSEGLGSPEFRAAQQRLIALGPERFLTTLTAKTLADIDEWQTEMHLRPLRAGTVQLHAPQLSAEDAALTAVSLVDSVSEAVAESVARNGEGAVAVLPEGPYVVPRLDTAT